MTTRMYAKLVSPGQFAAGDLVLVEVPPNCVVTSLDAARLGRLRQAATALAAVRRRGGSPAEVAAAAEEVARHADISEDP